MWAVVVRVELNDGDASRKELGRDVVPAVKQAPGFTQGIWAMHENRTSGTALMVFEDEQKARDAASTITVGTVSPAGTTTREVGVYEVMAQA